MILLVGEVEEYKANPNRKAIGTVIEARLIKAADLLQLCLFKTEH